MNRNKAIATLVAGEKALAAYDGAASAWRAFDTFRTGAEELGVVSSQRTSGELAIAAIFTGVMGILVLNRKD